jgi:signal transduction protein with GAF and PtsI domain
MCASKTLMRDEVARNLASQASALNQALSDFKKKALGDMADLIKIAGERYEVTLGGKKGNVSISSYDGKYKVQRSVADRIQFTEEIEAAKALINQCIARWSEGANDNIRAIVDRAFSKDTKGQISAVLDLMRLEIDDAEWKRAMEAIRDSIQTTGTAVYVRVYERIGDSDQYKAIPLDLAAV